MGIKYREALGQGLIAQTLGTMSGGGREGNKG